MTAVSEDGIREAIEDGNIIGVQYHPEKLDNIKLINKNKTKNSTFIYSGDDISLLNNEEDVSINDFEIPDDIIVKIQYDNNSDRISKNDLKLYLDLSEGIVSGTRYAITHNDINVKSITIEPSYITAK